jgi:hypothetical protein
MKTVTLGIDVSKATLDAALWLADRSTWHTKAKVDNQPAGVHALLDWLRTKTALAPSACRVVLEVTGVYHEAAAQVFHDAGCEVVIANIMAARYNPPLRTACLDLIGRGKTRMSALGALMRRLIHIAFGILKHQMPFNPALVSKIA